VPAVAAIVSPGLVSQLIRYLPGPLLRSLDAWSHRRARRRHDERMRRWHAHRALAAGQPRD
jgi:hypothetical protein